MLRSGKGKREKRRERKRGADEERRKKRRHTGKGGKKFKQILKVQVVTNRKGKHPVSGTDKRRTGDVNRSPVKGALCVGELAGNDTQGH